MTDYKVGSVVYSRAGHDKGLFFAVIAVQGQNVLLCDGKQRPLERPKRKNIKHIGLTGTVLDNGSMSANRALRRAIREYTLARNV